MGRDPGQVFNRLPSILINGVELRKTALLRDLAQLFCLENDTQISFNFCASASNRRKNVAERERLKLLINSGQLICSNIFPLHQPQVHVTILISQT